MITYIYTICDENERFINAYNQLSASLLRDDEIIVQYDTTNGDPILLNLLDDNNIQYIEYPFDGNFSDMKNSAISHATNKWIVQLDGDESLETNFLENIHDFLIDNSQYDGFWVKRIEYNIDTDEISNETSLTLIRIFRKLPWIKWSKKVHEQIEGTAITRNYDYSILHKRTTDEINVVW